MAEAEDVLNDVARHATIHIRRLWLKHRGKDEGPRPISLPEVRQRIDLLIHAAHGFSLPLRVAHVPALAHHADPYFQAARCEAIGLRRSLHGRTIAMATDGTGGTGARDGFPALRVVYAAP